MKRGLALLWLVVWSGCSNPFSGDAERSAKYHSPNLNCQQLRLDKSEFNVQEFRGLVHCLNSDGNLQELEAFLETIPDDRLSAASDFINVLLNQDLRTLYTIRESYELLKSRRLLIPVLDQAAALEDVSGVAPAAGWIADVLFDRELGIHKDHLKPYLDAASFKRLFAQHRDGPALDQMIRLLDVYLRDNPEFGLEALYRILDQSGASLPSDPKSLASLASFLETIFAQRQFGGFSRVLETASAKPVECFDKSVVLFDPISVAVRDVLTANAADTRDLLQGQARALVMAARGYCSIGYSVEPLFRFTDPLLAHPGFERAYSFLLPLVRSPRFVRFISRGPSRDWTMGHAFLAEKYAFQDLFTLVAINKQLPLTAQPERAARYLDRLFRELDGEQLVRLAHVAGPPFRDLSRSPLLDVESALPEFNVSIDNSLRQRLRDLTAAALASPKLQTLLPMLRRLHRDNKLIPIWDEVFNLFERRIVLGKSPLKFAPATKVPPVARQLGTQLLEKIRYSASVAPCAAVDTDFAFVRRELRGSSTWTALDRCFGSTSASRATVRAGKELSDFAVAKGRFETLVSIQGDLLSAAVAVDRESTLNVLSRFARIRDSDSTAVRHSLQQASAVTRLVAPSLLTSPGLRELLADGAEDPRLYRGLIELHRHPAKPLPSRAMTLEPRSTVDTWIAADRSQSLSVLQGVQRLMQEYCPSLDIQDRDCDVEDDQVQLYRASPERLAAQVIEESIHRPNSWIHPAMSKGWSHGRADEVRDFEYHFHPLLHEFRAGGGLGTALFDFFASYRDRIRDLQSFIQVHARHYSLLPYVHHHPAYPSGSRREFTQRMRLKLVSDLDRLELIAINVDFRAFGFLQNFGMKFIRQIALSWGDEPASKRPAGTTAQTLASTTEDIERFVAQIDRQAIQKLGECDPRGKSRFGRWLQKSVCKGEIADFYARVFNLKLLTQLFTPMQVREAGGNDGMRILRDLFYALYSTDSDQQRDRFGKGADLPDSCLAAPGSAVTPEECRLDQLTLIGRVTRLGLLHQTGVSAAFTPGSSVDATLQTLAEVSSVKSLRQQLADWLQQPKSSQTLLSVKDWVSALPPDVDGRALHSTLRLVSQLRPFDWVGSFSSTVEAEPQLVRKLSAPLLQWLRSGADGAPSATFLDRSASLRAWTSDRLGRLGPQAQRELTQVLLAIVAQPESLDRLIRQGRDLPEFDQPAIESELYRWLGRFAAPEAQARRAALKRYLRGPETDRFCDVFSDSALVDRTYNFLEAIHQNPDSDRFFTTCRAFLFR